MRNLNNIDNSDNLDDNMHDFTLEEEDIMVTFDRDTRRQEEYEKLTNLFTGLDSYKEGIAFSLCEELSSLKVTMLILKAEYESRGEIDEMQQGEYTILRESPYFTAYVKALRQYAALFKQVADLYPKENEKIEIVSKVDQLQKFMGRYS